MVTVQVADLSHENFKSSRVMRWWLSRLSSRFSAKSSRECNPKWLSGLATAISKFHENLMACLLHVAMQNFSQIFQVFFELWVFECRKFRRFYACEFANLDFLNFDSFSFTLTRIMKFAGFTELFIQICSMLECV